MKQIQPRSVLLFLFVAMPIALGVLKIYLHLNSVWRFGPLDYIVSVGLIAGGLFLFLKSPSRAILVICSILLALELYKAVTDYQDHFDLFITAVSIIYLSIPILRHTRKTLKDRQNEVCNFPPS